MMLLATEAAPGSHPTVSICSAWYCTFNWDGLLSTGVAIIATLLVAFWLRASVRPGRPSKVQMVFELFLSYVRGMVHENVSEEATFVIPLAATIGFFILVANWLDFFPLFGAVHPANADINQTLAMALVVIVVVQAYSIRVLGFGGYLRRFTKPFEMALPVRIAFIPLNIIEELVKPVTLALRLFGNIFAGVLMVYLLTLLFQAWATGGSAVSGALSPLAIIGLIVWKFFDVFFVGSLQAFIFMLLTIIYFHMAREGLEEEAHHAPQTANA